MSEYTPTTEDVRFAMAGLRMSAERFVTRDSFDRWLAAHDAEVRADEAAQWAQAVIDSGKQGERIGAARAGVVAEEPEWEYGVKFDDLPGRVFDRLPGDPRATHRRRKADPWVPVKQEGAE